MCFAEMLVKMCLMNNFAYFILLALLSFVDVAHHCRYEQRR